MFCIFSLSRCANTPPLLKSSLLFCFVVGISSDCRSAGRCITESSSLIKLMSYDSKLKSKSFLQGHVKAAHTVAVKRNYNHLTLSKKKTPLST